MARPLSACRAAWVRALLWGALAAVASCAVALVLLLLGPWGRLSLTMDLRSSTAAYSQVFFTDGDAVFTEARSVGQPVQRGENRLRLGLSGPRGIVGDHLRWDPLDAPGEVLVRAMRLESALTQADIPLSILRPSTDMSAIDPTSDGVAFTTFSNDGQLQFTYPVRAVYDENLRRGLLVSVAPGLLLGGITAVSVAAAARRRGTAAAGRSARPGRGLALQRVVLGFAVAVCVSGVLLILWSTSI